MRSIAQLRQHIDEEIKAMNHAKGFAAVARHEMITRHFDRLGVYLEALTHQIGADAAIELIVKQMEQGNHVHVVWSQEAEKESK